MVLLEHGVTQFSSWVSFSLSEMSTDGSLRLNERKRLSFTDVTLVWQDGGENTIWIWSAESPKYVVIVIYGYIWLYGYMWLYPTVFHLFLLVFHRFFHWSSIAFYSLVAR